MSPWSAAPPAPALGQQPSLVRRNKNAHFQWVSVGFSRLHKDHAAAQSVMLATWIVFDGKRPEQVYLALLATQAVATRDRCPVAHADKVFKPMNPYQREGNVHVFTHCNLPRDPCGGRVRNKVVRDAYERRGVCVTGSSTYLSSGAQEKARLVEDADEYCKRRGKSAVVIASRENDAKPGTLAAPGKIARATVEFRCQ